MKQIIAIVGQTAVGKTRLSLQLAKLLDGEIINGDAMQVYKGLDIVTAKIKEEEKEGIPHHLFDLKNVNDTYSVEEYQRNIRRVIEEVQSRGKTPIVVGGTGLYIKAAFYDYSFNKQEVDHQAIEEKYKNYSNEELYALLKQVDEKACETIHCNNRVRVLRAISIFEQTGKTKSETIESQSHTMLYDVKLFCLYLPKDELILNINQRVEQMIQDGLIEEIKTHPTTSTASKAIGYKEALDYLNGLCSLNECVEAIKLHTRQYAKRQMTWFKHQFDQVIWIENNENALENIQSYLN